MKRSILLLTVLALTLVAAIPGAAIDLIGQVKAADTDGNRINDNLEALMETLPPGEKIPTIVMFSAPGYEPGKAHPIVENAVSAVESRFGPVDTKYRYINLPARAMSLTRGQVMAFAENPAVIKVQLDAKVQACMGTASNYFGCTKARADFGLSGDMDGNPTGYSKNDVVVAVIDTGIDTTHVDLDGGKVIAWKDWVNDKTAPYDDNGHGTHCSGIIAGTGEGNATYIGTAPGAALIGLKVLNRRGSGDMSDVDAAIDWCITNKTVYGIRILSMSLGTSGSSDGTDSTSLLVNQAYSSGMVVCVAAGNAGPNLYTIGSPGAAADALTVGAMADPGEKGFFQAYFSSRGPTADGRIKPDVSAPGYNIMSVASGTVTGYISKSGTSMATPFVAGTVALMLDANPALTPGEIKTKIASTVLDFGPAGQDVDYGWGRLQSYEAIKSAGAFSGTGPVIPQHYYFTGAITVSGQNIYHSFPVTSTASPIAVTLILGNASSDFDIYLYNPAGVNVAKAATNQRQETLTFIPTVTGTYQLKVYAKSGIGSYFFDLSCN